MRIKIYGSRGTLPHSSKEKAVYGGNTSCILVQTRGRNIILDCGSGLAGLQSDFERTVPNWAATPFDILLGHLHLDHIIGLPTFFPLWYKGSQTSLYTLSRMASPINQQVFGVFQPPYWPVNLPEICTASITGFKDYQPFFLGDEIKVTPFPMNHPDGTTGFRIDSDYSLVYLLDCEIEDSADAYEKLLPYCQNADLIVFDCSYSPEDLLRKQGWGHSSHEQGIRLAGLARCKRMLFSHFNHTYTDEQLNRLKQCLEEDEERYLLAFDGMELTIDGKEVRGL